MIEILIFVKWPVNCEHTPFIGRPFLFRIDFFFYLLWGGFLFCEPRPAMLINACDACNYVDVSRNILNLTAIRQVNFVMSIAEVQSGV